MNATNAPNGVLAVADEVIREFVSAGKIVPKEVELLHGGQYVYSKW